MFDSSAGTGGQLGHNSENDCWVPSTVPAILGLSGKSVPQLVHQGGGDDGPIGLAWRVLQVPLASPVALL